MALLEFRANLFTLLRGGWVVLAISIGSAQAAPSGSPPFWPDAVDTVRVSADRPDRLERLNAATSFGSYIPLGPDQPASRDLSDVLDRLAGVHVHRYGGLGAFSQASIRGSTPGQVRVYLDDVPISNASEGAVDLSLLPVANLEHAEIYRGAQAIPFGGTPGAGAIRLFTPGAVRTPLRIGLAGGSFGTRVARAQWGGSHSRFGMFFAGQYRRSEGDYLFHDLNGTPHNRKDDRESRRANNDFDETALFGRFSVDAGASIRLEYTAQGLDRENGVSGTAAIQTREVRFATTRVRHQLTIRARPPYPRGGRSMGRPALELLIHRAAIRDRFENRKGEVGLGRAATDDRTVDGGAEARAELPLLTIGHRFTASLERNEERFVPRDRLRSETGFARVRSNRNLLVGDRWDLPRLRLAAEGVYRWIRAEDNYGGPTRLGRPPEPSSPRVHRDQGASFGLKVDLGRGLELRGNRGRLIRLPTFAELFGSNGVQDGNRILRPEAGLQWDAGLVWRPRPALSLGAAYFESVVEEMILLLQNSQRTVKAQNLDRAWIRGLEASADGAVAVGPTLEVGLEASLTWQEARDVGPSRTYRRKELPNLPGTEGYLSLRFTRPSNELRYELSARSAAFRDRYNSPEKKTSGYLLHAVSFEQSLSARHYQVRFEVRNLTNRRVEDIDGFPLPGRSMLMEVVWTR